MQANLLRLYVGTAGVGVGHDEVTLLETNIDDATGEQLVFRYRAVMGDAGAPRSLHNRGLDEEESTGRFVDGPLSTNFCERMEDLIFMHTGSLGIRRQLMARRKLHREIIRVETAAG